MAANVADDQQIMCPAVSCDMEPAGQYWASLFCESGWAVCSVSNRCFLYYVTTIYKFSHVQKCTYRKKIVTFAVTYRGKLSVSSNIFNHILIQHSHILYAQKLLNKSFPKRPVTLCYVLGCLRWKLTNGEKCGLWS